LFNSGGFQASEDKSISGVFIADYFALVLQQLKLEKAPGFDSICPEKVLNAGSVLKSWLYKFLSTCLQHLKLPKFRRAAVNYSCIQNPK